MAKGNEGGRGNDVETIPEKSSIINCCHNIF